jgi:cytochrome b561
MKDTKEKFGIVTKLFHWVIALLVLAEVCLVYYTEWVLRPHSPIAGYLINNLHKPIGMTILGLAILYIIWRFSNTRPSFPSSMQPWEKISAKIVHRLLFLSILLMPLSGFMMSMLAGYPPNYFGLYQAPQFIQKNEAIAKLFFEIHGIVGNITIALIAIHLLAALKHHFINRDDVLTRMLR